MSSVIWCILLDLELVFWFVEKFLVFCEKVSICVKVYDDKQKNLLFWSEFVIFEIGFLDCVVWLCQ